MSYFNDPIAESKQTVDTVEVLAYLKDTDTQIEGITPVLVTIVNGWIVADVKLNGKHVADFDDLETDVKEGLTDIGYNVKALDFRVKFN